MLGCVIHFQVRWICCESVDLLHSLLMLFNTYIHICMSWGHFEKGSLQDLFTTICFWKIFRGWLRPTFPNLRATFLVSRVSTMFRLMFIGNVRTNVRHQAFAEDRLQCLCPNLFRNNNFFESKHSESIFVLHNLPTFSKQYLSLSVT